MNKPFCTVLFRELLTQKDVMHSCVAHLNNVSHHFTCHTARTCIHRRDDRAILPLLPMQPQSITAVGCYLFYVIDDVLYFKFLLNLALKEL